MQDLQLGGLEPEPKVKKTKKQRTEKMSVNVDYLLINPFVEKTVLPIQTAVLLNVIK